MSGYLYLAKSADLGLIKVGFSGDDPDNRIDIANLEGYGGAWDWQICLTVWADHAGAKEIAVHQSLADFRAERAWIRMERASFRGRCSTVNWRQASTP